jgi:hypothetical protein
MSSTVPRIAVRIHYSSVIDATSTFIGFRSNIASVRSSVSVDGTGFWIAGYQDGTTLDGGIRYVNGSGGITTSLDTGISKSYKAGVIVNNKIFWNDQQRPCNNIEYMAPIAYTASNIGGQQVSAGSCPTSFSLGFAYINASLLFVSDYGVGLRRFVSSATTYVTQFTEDIWRSPVYPTGASLPDYRNIIGVEWAGSTLLYVTTPSALYAYDFIALTWSNGGQELAIADASIEFRGVAMAPSSPTASATGTRSPTGTSSVTTTRTATSIPTQSSRATLTSSATDSASATATASTTATSSQTSSSAASASYTSTPTRTASITGTSSQTATSSVSALPQPVLMTNSGSVQVPPNIAQVKLTMWGAGGNGGSGSAGSSSWMATGGGGAFVTGILDVTPMEFLNVTVGLGGGGASIVRRSGVTLVVAAGGGGASGYYGNPPTGAWRTNGWGGGGGLSKGCDPVFEVPSNGRITITTLYGLGGPANGTNSCPFCQGGFNCTSYGSEGGDGDFAGANSCYGGAGGGASLLTNLRDSDRSESAVCGSSRPGGTRNPYYSGAIANGGLQGKNGLVVLEWVWPNPIYLPPSVTASPISQSATKSFGASGTQSPSAIIYQHVPKSHLACSVGPAAVSTLSVLCPAGSTIGSISMGCGTYAGTCGNYELVGCNAMTKQMQGFVQRTCTGANGCSFSGAQLCSGSQDDDSCVGAELSAVLQASCVPGAAMLEAEALGAMDALDVTSTTQLRYVQFQSVMELSDGIMGFAELQIFTRDGVNIAMQGTATSSSVLNSDAYGPNDYYICGATSHIASAAIDGNACTFFAANYDAQPWWKLDLGYGVPLSDIAHIDIYVRQAYNNPYGATIDYSYQLDSASVTLADAADNIFFTGTLPWLSTVSQPFVVNVSAVLVAAAATTDAAVLHILGF